MLSFIKKTTVILATGSFFLASPALALEPKLNKPTIVKPDWHVKYVKETSNDFLKPERIEIDLYYPKEQHQYETANKFEVVPMQNGYATYEKYDPDADYVDEDSFGEEPGLNSTENDQSSQSTGDQVSDLSDALPVSPKSEGDVLTDDSNISGPAQIEDENIITYEEGTTSPSLDLKLPEFDSLKTPKKDAETSESIPQDSEAKEDYDFEEELVYDSVKTTVKIKVVLQFSEGSYEDGSFDLSLEKSGTPVLDAETVSFTPSETVEGKGTLVSEFENTENFSHDDFEQLVLKSSGNIKAEIVSYSVVITKKGFDSKEIALGDDNITSSFTTDSETVPSLLDLSTSVKIKHSLQYNEGATYSEGSLDSTIYDGSESLLEPGTGEKNFKAGSTEGKGTLTVYYSSTSPIQFGDISKISLQTNGSVEATVLNYSVEIEKKVKPSDTTLSPSEESTSLLLPVF